MSPGMSPLSKACLTPRREAMPQQKGHMGQDSRNRKWIKGCTEHESCLASYPTRDSSWFQFIKSITNDPALAGRRTSSCLFLPLDFFCPIETDRSPFQPPPVPMLHLIYNIQVLYVTFKQPPLGSTSYPDITDAGNAFSCTRPLNAAAGEWRGLSSVWFWPFQPGGGLVTNFLVLQLNSYTKICFWKHSRQEIGNSVIESWFIFDQHCLVWPLSLSAGGLICIKLRAESCLCKYRYGERSVNSPCHIHHEPRVQISCSSTKMNRIRQPDIHRCIQCVSSFTFPLHI